MRKRTSGKPHIAARLAAAACIIAAAAIAAACGSLMKDRVVPEGIVLLNCESSESFVESIDQKLIWDKQELGSLTAEENGKVTLRSSTDQLKNLRDVIDNFVTYYAKSAGTLGRDIEVSDDHRSLTVTVDESFAENPLSDASVNILAEQLLLWQFANGCGNEDLSLTTTVMDSTTGETLSVTEWPEASGYAGEKGAEENTEAPEEPAEAETASAAGQAVPEQIEAITLPH